MLPRPRVLQVCNQMSSPPHLHPRCFKNNFLIRVNMYIQTFLCSYDIILGVECEGIRLNLTQPCRGNCNINAADEYRNYDGVVRAFVPCNSTEGAAVDQCIPEANVNDGTFNCRNRWSMKNCLNPNTMQSDGTSTRLLCASTLPTSPPCSRRASRTTSKVLGVQSLWKR